MPHDVNVPVDAFTIASRILAPVASLGNQPVADQLGVLRAWKKAIEARMADLRVEVVAAGGTVAGELFEASVGDDYVRTTVKRKELEADLGELVVRKYLKFTPCDGALTITARK